MDKKEIGSGYFTEVYDNEDGTVEVCTFCPIKKALSEFAQDSFLFPSYVPQGQSELHMKGEQLQSFESPYLTTLDLGGYEKLSSRSKDLYKQIGIIYDKCVSTDFADIYDEGEDLEGICDRFTKLFSRNLSDRFEKEKKEIARILENFKKYDVDVCFEVRDDNLAVNEKGDLILLDIFYCTKALGEY